MPTLHYDTLLTGLGSSIGGRTSRTNDMGFTAEIAVPAGKAGTLSTRTDNETGTLTLGSGHGITTGATIDLFWDGGARYTITVGTVSGTSVPIGADNAGTGDNLPTQATAIVASTRTSFAVPITCDEVDLIAVELAYDATADFNKGFARFDRPDDPGTFTDVLLTGNVPRVWDKVAGNGGDWINDPVATGVVSNGSTEAATLKIFCVQDA